MILKMRNFQNFFRKNLKKFAKIRKKARFLNEN